MTADGAGLHARFSAVIDRRYSRSQPAGGRPKFTAMNLARGVCLLPRLRLISRQGA
jgi:hypothetical protein